MPQPSHRPSAVVLFALQSPMSIALARSVQLAIESG